MEKHCGATLFSFFRTQWKSTDGCVHATEMESMAKWMGQRQASMVAVNEIRRHRFCVFFLLLLLLFSLITPNEFSRKSFSIHFIALPTRFERWKSAITHERTRERESFVFYILPHRQHSKIETWNRFSWQCAETESESILCTFFELTLFAENSDECESLISVLWRDSLKSDFRATTSFGRNFTRSKRLGSVLLSAFRVWLSRLSSLIHSWHLTYRTQARTRCGTVQRTTERNWTLFVSFWQQNRFSSFFPFRGENWHVSRQLRVQSRAETAANDVWHICVDKGIHPSHQALIVIMFISTANNNNNNDYDDRAEWNSDPKPKIEAARVSCW